MLNIISCRSNSIAYLCQEYRASPHNASIPYDIAGGDEPWPPLNGQILQGEANVSPRVRSPSLRVYEDGRKIRHRTESDAPNMILSSEDERDT